jgi:hypothetical protein
MSAYYDYPVELTGEYQERVNRLLWLIKWILVIPHYIVLWFLSIPTILTVPLSWLIIIIMGRYPEFLWGYHTGLLRWGWRVNFYTYDAGNTDQYPPFSFGSRDDYPADLIIEFPESSSRLTALFRWLLVIPHWIIVYFLGAIRDLLVLIALIATLFTGRYPESLFDIIMGMNRWVYRVSAYSVLLVDDYPPFSFD